MPKHILIEKFLSQPIARKAALIAAFSSFVASCILILASTQGNHQLIQRSSQLFGESVIQQLARDASNPLVQGDKLSLQSLLNQLVASPMVIRATIYDVENHPVAEAGTPSSGESLSASITFQDSIAGYAVITLDATPLQQQAITLAWQLTGLAVLLAGCCYLAGLIPARHISAILNDLKVIASTPIKQRNSHIAYHGDDELQQLAQQILAGTTDTSNQTALSHKGGQAVMAISFDSLDTTDTSSLTELQRQLHTICKLYEGDLQINRSNGLCIIFRPGDDEDSYPFRALCSGLLILEWFQQQSDTTKVLNIGLTLDANIDTSRTTLQQQLKQQYLFESAFNLASGLQGLIVDVEIHQHHSVKDRVNYKSVEEESEKFSIEALKEPYNALLERQLSALRAQLLR